MQRCAVTQTPEFNPPAQRWLYYYVVIVPAATVFLAINQFINDLVACEQNEPSCLAVAPPCELFWRPKEFPMLFSGSDAFVNKTLQVLTLDPYQATQVSEPFRITVSVFSLDFYGQIWMINV